MENQGHQHAEGCRKLLALLSDYIDADLPPDVCRQIEEHLTDCPPCVEFIQSLRGTVRLCHEYALAETPQPLPEGVRRELFEAYERAVADHCGGADEARC